MVVMNTRDNDLVVLSVVVLILLYEYDIGLTRVSLNGNRSVAHFC